MQFLPPAVTSLVAVLLAIFGWRIIIRISKRRESYDICSSVISLLERVENDVTSEWTTEMESLDHYTEKRLTTLTSGIELRLKILHNHYHNTRITTDQLRQIRELATLPRDLLDGEDRRLEIHILVTEIITILLEDNYKFINRTWMSFIVRKAKPVTD